MNFLAFLASVIGSLAWPTVAALFLFLIRTRIGVLIDALAARITKAKLPGGIEFEFSQKLEEARDEFEALVIEGKLSVPPVTETLAKANEDTYLKLAQISPPAAILEAFKEVELVIINNRDEFKDVKGHNLRGIVYELQRNELIDGQLVEQFNRVSQMRNLAAHAGSTSNISIGEAIEYRSLCRSLASAFDVAFARLKDITRSSGLA